MHLTAQYYLRDFIAIAQQLTLIDEQFESLNKRRSALNSECYKAEQAFFDSAPDSRVPHKFVYSDPHLGTYVVTIHPEGNGMMCVEEIPLVTYKTDEKVPTQTPDNQSRGCCSFAKPGHVCADCPKYSGGLSVTELLKEQQATYVGSEQQDSCDHCRATLQHSDHCIKYDSCIRTIYPLKQASLPG